MKSKVKSYEEITRKIRSLKEELLNLKDTVYLKRAIEIRIDILEWVIEK